MAIAQQTSELFARVFGRGPETSEETSFLRGVEQRKGVGTAASQGAIEFAKQQGAFGGFSQPDEQTIDVASQGMDLIKKKIKDIDAAEKKLFREEQKLEVKKQLLSDPGFKSLLETRKDLRSQLKERDFTDEVDVKPGITNPLDVSRAALNQQAGFASFIDSAANLADTTEESVTGIIDRLGDQRLQDYNTARQSLSDAITVNQEIRAQNQDLRAEELHDLTLKQSKLQIQQLEQTLKNGGLSPSERANFFIDWIESGGDPQDASTVLNYALGNPTNLPLVENQQKGGYQFGDKTFYGREHSGVDIISPAGSKIRANVDLKVERVFVGDEGGLQVWGVDSNGNRHRYMHLGGARVKPGDTLQAGQVFASVGSPKQHSQSELSSGSHVHYDIADSTGNFINPKDFKSPSPLSTITKEGGLMSPLTRETTIPGMQFGLQDVMSDIEQGAGIEGALARRQANIAAAQQGEIDQKVAEQTALEQGKRDFALENVQNSLNVWRDVSLGDNGVNTQSDADSQLNHVLDIAQVKRAHLPRAAEIALATGNPTGSPLFTLVDARIAAQGGQGEAARRDPNFARLQSLRLSLFNMVKAMGESGRLSDQDINAAMVSLPSMLDTKENAQNKIQTVERLMGKAANTAEGTHQATVLDGLSPGDVALMQQASNYISN